VVSARFGSIATKFRSISLASLVATALSAGPLGAKGKSLIVVPGEDEPTPALRYAALSDEACLVELAARGVSFTRVVEARGVRTPLRLNGPIRGVEFRTDYPDEQRATLAWEVYDCRLVLALDDFSRILAVHDIAQVRIFSAWRPPAKSWPEGRIGIRHPGGMAVDLREFRKRDGQVLNVDRHYHGRIGGEPCGALAEAPRPPTSAARELRSITCEAADARIFNSILTPNHDRAHFNHLHVEVRAGVAWYILR
jgi:hypothetical protein